MKRINLTTRWYLISAIIPILFLIGYFVNEFIFIGFVYGILLSILTLIDFIIVVIPNKFTAQRNLAVKLNLGEYQKVNIEIENQYPFKVNFSYFDELPAIFQKRLFKEKHTLQKHQQTQLSYQIFLHERGEFSFGWLNFFIQSPISFWQKKYQFNQNHPIKIYPSVSKLKTYQLLALEDNQSFWGNKNIRKLGQSLEFEQIREYVHGDDVRNMNWKATARKQSLMINTYIENRSQSIYAIIDQGRSMKMPFDGLTLLDHSINAALIFLNIALLKKDKAGLIIFNSKVETLLPANSQPNQIHKINEVLYNVKTNFKDSIAECLIPLNFKQLSQRTFLMLFSNIETLASLERQLPYYKSLAKKHLLCIVFFENTALKNLHETKAESLEQIYIQTIAKQFEFEKKQIVKTLQQNGILSILTTPKELTGNVVNKYLELKASALI